MKKMIKPTFCFALAVAAIAGIGFFAVPDDAEAILTCPPCYVPEGASGWSQYGSCVGGDPQSPVAYRQYKNNRSGQICRAQYPFADI